MEFRKLDTFEMLLLIILLIIVGLKFYETVELSALEQEIQQENDTIQQEFKSKNNTISQGNCEIL